MAKIVQLAQYRKQTALRDGLRPLRCKFNQRFDARTRLADLSAQVLHALAQPDDDCAQVLYAMIIGFLGHGTTARFHTLDSHIQRDVVDLHLFFSDQLRFEIMFRLGWLAKGAGRELPLFDLITQSNQAKILCQETPPRLLPNHPEYTGYIELIDRDQQVHIRRLMPSAMDAFKREHGL